ncbi:hypothetical protein CRYUN_Cryun24cG0035600 [Craigia yunnanensis]
MWENLPEKKSGCRILNAVFGKRNFCPRRSTSTGSLPIHNNNNNVKTVSSNIKRRRSGSDEASFFNYSVNGPEAPTKSCTKPPQNHPMPLAVHQQNQVRKPPNEATRITPNQGYVNPGRRVPKEAVSISGELESIIVDHQKTKGNSNLIRASSSNMMLFGNLGNLRQPGGGNTSSYNVLDQLPKTAREDISTPNGKYPNSVMGNVVKKQVEEKRAEEKPASLRRALSTRMDYVCWVKYRKIL